MRNAILGAVAAVAAAFALALTGGAAAAPEPAAVVPAPSAGAAEQPASPAAAYTWTRTDTSGRVVFTRSGVLTEAKTSFGGEQPQPVAGVTLRGVGTNACCSPSGCDTVDVVRNVGGLLWGWSTLAKFHHRVYWCWSYPRITGINVSCYATDLSQWFGVQFNGCGGGGYYYSWAGAGNGGHYSLRQGDFSQCIPSVACSAHVNPWIQIWVNGNGAWTQQQGS